MSRHGDVRWTDVDADRPIVCFGSFQDYLQRTASGAIKPRNEWVHETQWDCVILDEYHYGAWRENAKGLFGADGRDPSSGTERWAVRSSADGKGF